MQNTSVNDLITILNTQNIYAHALRVERKRELSGGVAFANFDSGVFGPGVCIASCAPVLAASCAPVLAALLEVASTLTTFLGAGVVAAASVTADISASPFEITTGVATTFPFEITAGVATTTGFGAVGRAIRGASVPDNACETRS